MRLPEFIEANRDAILAAWEEFASTREGAEHLDRAALRDHSASMLRDIVADLHRTQSHDTGAHKARAEHDESVGGYDSAAQAHGAERAHHGFSVGEMVSEFRALRASVLRLWTASRATLDTDDINDLLRFNASVDQSIGESVTRFTSSIDESKDLFLAILSHDLRAPLQTVLMVTDHLATSPSRDTTQSVLVSRASRSVTRMIELVDDLLDFTRTRMGAGLGIASEATDLSTLVQHAVEEIEAAHPQWAFEPQIEAGLWAPVDAARIRQVLANLLSNAVHHGDSSLPVSIRAHGTDRQVVIDVGNFGRVIPAADIAGLFSPFKRVLADAPSDSADHHLGLGLYITDRIVSAHNGRIDVTSSIEAGTTFRVTLPR
ncbi:sensor histidine kinase [Gemmatimonas groenlandica]|uniref:histidine kinase n=1 Tax=Gemmatimonas groenlandica TaxID=2732249 RepID=A0A6M4INX2_9BACT|nr:sensor histidine kinase [Gemmatimonas groenlandica]QJR34672.1 sensor histidine kinase [Gemmatimonas groenlandica]